MSTSNPIEALAYPEPRIITTTPAPGPNANFYERVVTKVTINMAAPNAGCAADIARDQIRSRDDLLEAAWNRIKVELLGICINDRGEGAMRDWHTWGESLWQNIPTNLRRFVTTYTVSVSPANLSGNTFRTIERNANRARRVMSRAVGFDIHQCLLDRGETNNEICVCLSTGVAEPNTGSSWDGQRGSLIGQLMDPPAATIRREGGR